MIRQSFPAPATPHAVFRVDASASIGGGHVKRCLVLAEALAMDGWRITFATRGDTLAAVPALGRKPYARVMVERSDEVRQMRARVAEGCDLLVVDHYGLDAAFETGCRGWARRVFVIEDRIDRRHDCDILVDQTPGRTEADHKALVPGDCVVLVGSSYALIDRRFRLARQRRRRAEDRVDRIFVNFGSTDPADATSLTLEGLRIADLGAEVDIVLGRASDSVPKARELAARLSPPGRVHVDVDDMADLMARADIAIGAGGVSSLERCCVGLPSVIVTMADNQLGNAAALGRAGAALDLGPVSRVSATDIARAVRDLAGNGSRRAVMSKAGASMVDGWGAERVRVSCYPGLQAGDGKSVRIRPASFADSTIMLAWQTAPGARTFARNPEPPDLAGHEVWLKSKLEDDGCIINVVLHGGEPAGVLRFEYEKSGDARYEVSILIASEHQNVGVGVAALELGRRLMAPAILVAFIMPGNVASRRIFERAGYRLSGNDTWILGPGREQSEGRFGGRPCARMR